MHQPPAGPTPLPIDALHASVVRAVSSFMRKPEATVAETIVRLLAALAEHPDRFVAPCGHDVYPAAMDTWRALALEMRQCEDADRGVMLH